MHVPEPWRASKDNAGEIGVFDGMHNVLRGDGPFSLKEREAHAKMMAASKELLEALKRMVNTHGMHGPCTEHNCHDCQQSHTKAIQAIAKAEGGAA